MSNNKKLTILTFIGIVLYYIAIMFQGFDVCDEGFALSSYQQIFNAPESIEYNMLFWLTTVLGGIWYNIFPDGGIISFRILGAITLISTMLITLKLLKNYLKTIYILIGILMVMVSKGIGVVNFSYNTLSGFMSVIIMFFLFKALIKQKPLFILLAGVFTGMITFASLPAFTIFALFLTIPFYLFINKQLARNLILKNTIAYSLGILVGFAFIFSMMKYLGHLEIYKKAICMITRHSVASDSNHNLMALFKKYIIDYIGVIKVGTVFTLGTFTLILSKQYLKKKLPKTIWLIISFIFYAILIKGSPIFSTYFLSIVGTSFYAFNKKETSQVRLIAFGALITAIFFPLGTDPGIHSIGHASIWICLPFFFSLTSKIEKIEIRFLTDQNNYYNALNQKSIKKAVHIYLLAFFCIKFYLITNGAYFDPGTRFNKTATIYSPLAKHIHTTPERASIINLALNKIYKITKPGDYLMVYDKMPILHYLTQTKPYVYNPWVWAYDSHNFEQQLRRAELEIKELPIVLVQKFETIFKFFEPVQNYLDESAEDTYLNRVHSHKALNAFLKRNQYEVIWENNYYCIYRSKKTNLIK